MPDRHVQAIRVGAYFANDALWKPHKKRHQRFCASMRAASFERARA